MGIGASWFETPRKSAAPHHEDLNSAGDVGGFSAR